MGIDRDVIDARAQADLYNAGLSVKDKEKDPLAYVEEFFGGQTQSPDYVPGYIQRELMAFHVPTVGTIEMYINPQSFVINSKKQITEIRTKGGYVMQYWGEELDNIVISGTTGSSGIEGINILRDIYRSEQKNFSGIGQSMFSMVEGSINSMLANASSQSEFGREVGKYLSLNTSTKPTLASLAAGITLLFQGVFYSGFFTAFDVTEKAEEPGIFDYTMTFRSFARKGTRKNFMPWHRSPNHGPANSDAMVPTYKEIANPIKSDRAAQQILDRSKS